MKLGVFSIFDAKAKCFSRPFYETRKELAVRSVTAVVRDPAQMLGKFPEDYDLYCLGQFDDELGTFEVLERPEIVCKLIQLKGGE